MSLRRFLPVALIFLAFCASIVVAHAWTPPPSAPPGGNVSAPLNVGANSQTKPGFLQINNTAFNNNSLSVVGNLILSGTNRYLNFGTTWDSGGYGIRDNAGVMEYKNSTGSWTSFVSSSVWATVGSNIYNNNTGNVGIGTSNPTRKLYVVGTSGASPDVSNNTNDIAVLSNNGQAFLKILGNANLVGVTFGNAGVSGSLGSMIYDLATNHLRFSTNNTERMRIASGGNVGIGTTNPTSILHIATAGNTYFRIGAPLAFQSAIAFNDDTNGQDVILYRPAGTRDFRIWTAGVNDALAVLQNGNVGIAKVAPAFKLDVNGSVNATQYCIAGANCISAWPGGAGGGIGGGGNINYVPRFTPDGVTLGNSSITSDAVSATANGNLFVNNILYAYNGVMLSSTNQHYLYSDGANSATLRINNGATPSAFVSFKALASGPSIDGPGGVLMLSTTGSERLRITSTGNVGIGTGAPTQKLDVAGNINVPTGSCFMINGTCISSGSGIPEAPSDGTTYGRRNATWVAVSGGGIGGSGTLNRLARFTPNGTTLGDSTITDNGVSATANSNFFVNGVVYGAFTAGTGDAFQIGNDSKLVDINVANTGALYGAQNAAIGSLKLGSGGGTISGSAGNIGIAKTNPAFSLDVNGTVNATQYCIAGANCISAWPGAATNYWTLTSGNLDSNASVTGRVAANGRDSNGYALSLPTGGIWANGTNISGDSIQATGGINATGRINTAGNLTVAGTASVTGNVGIGTASPGQKLDVVGNVQAQAGNPRYILRSNDANTADRVIDVSGVGGAAQWRFYKQVKGTDPTLTFMTIASGGNVGIGVTNPGFKLDVAGNINVPTGSCFMINGACISSGGGLSGGSASFLPIWTSATTIGNSIISANSSSATVNDANFYVRAASNGASALNVQAPGGNLVAIKPETAVDTAQFGYWLPVSSSWGALHFLGTVGINTLPGVYRLNVAGDANATRLCIAGDCRNAWPSGGGLSGGVTGALPIWTSATTIGNSIIAADATSATVTGVLKTTGRIFSGAAGTGGMWVDGTTGSATQFVGSQSATALGFYNGGAWRLVVNSSGNVGVGALTPAYKLDVAGDVNVPLGSCFRINGTCISGGGGIGGSGTVNYVPRFTPNGTTLGNSTIMDDGASATANGNFFVNGVVHGAYTSGFGDAFRIGNDSKLVDINVANTAALNGLQNTAVGSLKLGSGGGTISGSAGNIGINTINPTASLDVNGTVKATFVQANAGIAAAVGGTNVFLTGGNGNGDIELGPQNLTASTPFIDFHYGGTSADYNMRIWNNADGQITVERFGGGGNLVVLGNAYASAFIYNSDARLKKDIAPLTGNLDKVLHLKPVTYLWKDTSKQPSGEQLGFIAQEVEKIVPDIVYTDGNTGMKGIDYVRLTPLLVGSVQELNAKIDSQQEQIDELKAQLQAILGQ